MARVDIVMPVRNGMPFLEAAVASIAGQTNSDWRLHVLDHASTDSTPDIIDRLSSQDRRIVRHNCSADLTLSELRNWGLELCDSEYVVLHDADDISLPHRLRRQQDYLSAHPHLAIAGSSYFIVDSENNLLGKRVLYADRTRISVASLFSNPIAQPTVMLRSSLVHSLGARYGDGFLGRSLGIADITIPTLAEDYLLFGQLAMLGQCGNVPEPLIRYRRHASGTSISKFADQMRVSADVSRYLMHVLAARHGLAWQDPMPFCNHGAQLYPVDDVRSLPGAWRKLIATIEKAFGRSSGAGRELAFRATLADRRPLVMLAAFARFIATHRTDSDEVATMRHAARSVIAPRRSV